MPFISEPTLSCKRCSLGYSIIYHISSSSSNEQSNAYHSNTPCDYCRVIYYEVLDFLITLLNERFDQLCFKVYENLESHYLNLYPTKVLQMQLSMLNVYVNVILTLILTLVVELQILKAMCQNQNSN